MLKKKSLQVQAHLSKMYSTCNDRLGAVDKHLICKFDIKALGYCTRITRAMLCLANGVSADQKIRLHTHQLFQFESYFQPLPNPCNLNTTHAIENVASGLHNLVTISKMSSRDSDEFPLSVPAVFRQDLILQTDNPSVWYMGQLVEFLTKPTSLLDTFLGAKVMELEIGEKPIAGLHVRRGDFSEVVAPQPIEKYLALVEDFFLQCDLKADRPVERRVFLATDDESVLEVVKANYPQYTVFTNSSHSQHAVNKWHGYYSSGEEVSAAIGEIILDTLILSKVDFFVGTLTSHVSKVVAMLRAARDPNAEESMFSLDSDFFIEGVLEPLTYRAVAPHNVPGEISFDVDTLVSVRLKHSVVRKFPTLPIDTNGFSYGILKQDRILGHFPMYKLAYAWDWLLVPNELRNASNWFSRRK